jgi:Bacterial SH3 domain
MYSFIYQKIMFFHKADGRCSRIRQLCHPIKNTNHSMNSKNQTILGFLLIISVLCAGFTPQPSVLNTDDPIEIEPVIRLKACVDGLRLRSGPSPDASVVGILTLNHKLGYLGITSGEETEVVLRGVKRKGRWHKVVVMEKTGKDPLDNKTGWVFAGAVVIESMYIQSERENFRLDQISCDFFSVKKITKMQYETYKSNSKQDTLVQSCVKIGDSTFVSLQNGQQHLVYQSLTPCKAEENGADALNYIGTDFERSVFYVGRYCEHYEINNYYVIEYRLSDGSQSATFEDVPSYAPDGLWSVEQSSGDCGSYFALVFSNYQPKSDFVQPSFTAEIQDYTAYDFVWIDDAHQLALRWDDDRTNDEAYYVLSW